MKRTPLTIFRVRPDYKRQFYFTVVVWNTLDELRSEYRGLGSPAGKTLGFCRSHIVLKKHKNGWHANKNLGEIHYAKSFLKTCVLTHECVHAALAFAGRLRVKFSTRHLRYGHMGICDPAEETICYAAGELMRQVVNGLYEKKLLPQ